MFSETLVPKGGSFWPAPPPPTNSKTKDATTTKLCTVTVRHLSTKNQQLDFPNFHCSIVCSYCSTVCLIIKSGPKMVKISNASYENEIHKVDSPFNKDSNNIIFCQGSLNFGGGRPENLGRMARNRETYCYANYGVVNSNREYWPLLPGIKVFAILWFSCMLDQIIC